MLGDIQKGQKIELTKTHQGLNRVMVGLGWDPARKTGLLGKLFKGSSQHKGECISDDIDCDAIAIMLDENYKIRNRDYIIYYGNLSDPAESVKHMGDNVTGEGSGDDEEIRIVLDKVPDDVYHIIFAVTIYECEEKAQDFGLIKNLFIRVVDEASGKELLRYDIGDGFEGKTAFIAGEVYRKETGWKFAAIGEGTSDKTLGGLLMRYR